MSDIRVSWSTLTNRREALELAGFTCVRGDPPRRRRDRQALVDPWEWEAQAAIRQLGQRLRHDGKQCVVVGTVDSDVVAVAHLELVHVGSMLEVFVYVAAVARSRRGAGGVTADALMSRITTVAEERAGELGATTCLVFGKIHVRNFPSQNWVERHGFEPAPEVPQGEYQLWTLHLERH